MPNEKDEPDAWRCRMPTGEVITVKRTRAKDGSLIITPISNNPGHVHDHVFDRDGEYHYLVRNPDGTNRKAYVLNLDTEKWSQRSLTAKEQTYVQSSQHTPKADPLQELQKLKPKTSSPKASPPTSPDR
jgi:hypothetical protein